MRFTQSTPQTYVNALKKEQVEWPVKQDDFFPYSSDPHWYWSGFYSSRPAFKKQVRDASAAWGAHSKLLARKAIDLGTKDNEIDSILKAHHSLLDGLGVSQHHDAITGTAKQYVTNDYSVRLWKGVDKS